MTLTIRERNLILLLAGLVAVVGLVLVHHRWSAAQLVADQRSANRGVDALQTPDGWKRDPSGCPASRRCLTTKLPTKAALRYMRGALQHNGFTVTPVVCDIGTRGLRGCRVEANLGRSGVVASATGYEPGSPQVTVVSISLAVGG